eukprot:TRINITY_DN42964_c0_g1_i1.p1 TRINITY_DN42964_c0_g1~~TRINITY_DN42964_c0_g1_i1.p1  ORF type:complete len:523 (+),score=132.28 TRINITY_DN42964_c0_g1_i1:88-1569(+)
MAALATALALIAASTECSIGAAQGPVCANQPCPARAFVGPGGVRVGRALLGGEWDTFWTDSVEKSAVLLQPDASAVGVPIGTDAWMEILMNVTSRGHSSMELMWGEQDPGLSLGADIQIGSGMSEADQAALGEHSHSRGKLRAEMFIPRLLEAQGTAIFHDFDGRHPDVAALSDAVNLLFGHDGGVSVYLSGPNTTAGVPPHHDVMDVIALQVSGKKTWRLWKDAAPMLPRQDMIVSPDRISAPVSEATEVVLQEGDALYVPRGLVHQAVTNDDPTPSVHLSIGVESEGRTWEGFMHFVLDAAAAAQSGCGVGLDESVSAGTQLTWRQTLHIALHIAATLSVQLRGSVSTAALKSPAGAAALAREIPRMAAAAADSLAADAVADELVSAATPLLHQTSLYWTGPHEAYPMESGPVVQQALSALTVADVRTVQECGAAALASGDVDAARSWDQKVCESEGKRRAGWSAWANRNAKSVGRGPWMTEADETPPHCQ